MSKTLRVASRRGFDDSDSDSDFYYNSQDEDEKEDRKGADQELPEIHEDCPWRSAVDPTSGKTYYYHVQTRETQWMKPIEMASREEKEALAAKERRQKEFFAAMEANIMQSIAQGFKAPEKKSQLDMEFENKEISADPLKIKSSGSTHAGRVSPVRSRLMRNSSTSSRKELARELSRPNLVRTISSMDSNVLRDLIARVPSTRHVMGGGSSRQSSNRSIGFGMGDSSHTARSAGRFAALNANRGLSAKKVPAGGGGNLIQKIKSQKLADDDDDDLPPLTVVTTPDLRKRESLGLDALQVPRGDLTRTNSLTLDQLALQGGGGVGMDSSHKLMEHSKFMDMSMGSRLTMSNNSINFDPDESHSSSAGGYLSYLQGSSHNKTSHGGGFGGNGSFHSFDSSEGSLGGLNSSSNALSVSSNLLPVEEVLDESEISRKVVLEGENEDADSVDEPSLSFGRENDFPDDTTQNWLDNLPPEDGTRSGEEIVGYGVNAKPFSDAGFTSFFDESMANFDLSDKETKALQKLALISEQMAKVTEGDDESDESEESEDEDSDDIDLNTPVDGEEQREFPLSFESEEEEDAVTDESDEGQTDLSPFRTPVTTSTTKTSGPASTTRSARSKSPVHRVPPRRTLGPRNTRGISQAQRNLQITAEDSDEDGISNSTGGINLAVATLTIDNARSHGHRASAGEFSPKKAENGRPLMEKDHSESSLNSNSSLAMANAARRLSLFRLKNMDRSKLRSTSAGKGGLAKDLASSSPEEVQKKTAREISSMSKSSTAATGSGDAAGGRRDAGNRPNLVRRNTCGTLYVGTTMSAPDKDATIKCVCGVYRAHIHQSEAEDPGGESVHYRIFNDLESQQRTSSSRRLDHRRNNSALPVPSLDQITTFYRDVFQRAQMEYDCIIISLIYVERLIKTTRGALRPRACNWRSILFSCMVLASKVWDDLSMWNADFSQTCPNGVKFPLKRINELEVAILSALSYKVKVPASEYAKYYFLLRSMLIKSGLVDEDADTTSPLDVEGAKRLQQVSTQFQSGMGATRRQMRKAKSMRSKNMVRSKSVGVGEMKAPGAARKQKMNLENVVKM